MSRQAIPLNNDDRLLVRHVKDLADRSIRSGRTLFSNFLDDRQLAICEAALKLDMKEYHSFGGYECAERRVLAFGDVSADDNMPFSAVVFNYPKDYLLFHRDFLGSLMSLGIKRELVGDILVGEGRTAVFVIVSALPLVKEISKIGRVGVKVTEDFTDCDIPMQSYDEINSTVASLRLDSVVATAFRLSREKACELIRTKGVCQNRVMCFSPAERVCKGEKFSVRGFGKFELSEIGGLSKKDRIFITIKKYK